MKQPSKHPGTYSRYSIAGDRVDERHLQGRIDNAWRIFCMKPQETIQEINKLTFEVREKLGLHELDLALTNSHDIRNFRLRREGDNSAIGSYLVMRDITIEWMIELHGCKTRDIPFDYDEETSLRHDIINFRPFTLSNP